jgi:hypothetical protein
MTAEEEPKTTSSSTPQSTFLRGLRTRNRLSLAAEAAALQHLRAGDSLAREAVRRSQAFAYGDDMTQHQPETVGAISTGDTHVTINGADAAAVQTVLDQVGVTSTKKV